MFSMVIKPPMPNRDKFASRGMLSTAEDLVRFGVALLHGRLLKPGTVKLMFTPQLENMLQIRGNDPPEPCAGNSA